MSKRFIILAAVWDLRALLALTVPAQPTPGLSPCRRWPKNPFQLLPDLCRRWPLRIVQISWGAPWPDSTHPLAFIRWWLDSWWDLSLSPAQPCSGATGWFTLSEGMASVRVTGKCQLVPLSLFPEGLTLYWLKTRWFHRVFCAHWYSLSVSTKPSGPHVEVLVRASLWLWVERHRFCLLLHGSLRFVSF